MQPLSLAEVEDVLASVHRIRPDKRVAFRARLKNLQREGWPTGANTGTGRPARYTVNSLMQMAMALELLQAGMSPRRAVATLKAGWHDTAIALLMTSVAPRIIKQWSMAEGQDWDEVFWTIRPAALQELAEPPRFEESQEARTVRPSQLSGYLMEAYEVADLHEPSGCLVIGLRALRLSISIALSKVYSSPDRDDELFSVDVRDSLLHEILSWDLSGKDRKFVLSFQSFLKSRTKP